MARVLQRNYGELHCHIKLFKALSNIEINIVKLPTIKYLYSVVVDRHIYKSVKDTSGFLLEPKKELFTQYSYFLRSDVFLVIG